jgi:hypothetical protein
MSLSRLKLWKRFALCWIVKLKILLKFSPTKTSLLYNTQSPFYGTLKIL